MSIDFNIQTISKCRSLLMGYAILGVLIGHILVFGGIELSSGYQVVNWLDGLVHTSGFLFLSGFGVYYSLHKNGDILEFYRRRFYRFLLPFLIMAIPFFAIVCIVNGYGILQYLAYITTAEFWVNGNYHGMWYIAVSLLLYVITPPFTHLFTKCCRSTFAQSLLLICISILLCYAVKYYFPNYYEQSSIGLTPLPMFYVGFLFGDLSQRKIGKSLKMMICLCLMVTILYFVDFSVYGIGFIVHHLFGILLVCFFFKLLIDNKVNLMLRAFDWLGKYTLELYILHIYYWFIIKGVCHYGAMFNIITAVILSLLTCVPVHALINKAEELIKNK